MPFDVAEARSMTVLDRLGLMPVPAEILAEHKRQVHKLIYPTLSGYAQLYAKWYEFYPQGSRFFTQGTAARGPCAIDPLQFVIGLVGQAAGQTGQIPPEVVAIVEATESRARQHGIEMERVVGFYYTDPYVSLVYKEHGVLKSACLAIWDGLTVLHLATLT
jgi:hypothetical protein